MKEKEKIEMSGWLEIMNTINIDISLTDIVNSAIGAFFGMATSLMLEKIIISHRKRTSIKNIVSELVSIRDGIRSAIIDNIPDLLKKKVVDNKKPSLTFEEKNALKRLTDNIYDMAFVIYVPIWETVLQTGDILEFKNKEYFEELILLYTKIYKLKARIDRIYKDDATYSERDVIEILVECLEIEEIFCDKNSYYIPTLVK